jgi:hypothetical protein
MNFGEIVRESGIVLRSDNGKVEGVHPRWGKVWAIGPEQTDVSVGEWILVEHGRWSRGFSVMENDSEKTIHRVDPECIILVSDNPYL